MKTAITVILIIVAVAAVLFFLPLIIMFFSYVFGIDMDEDGGLHECIGCPNESDYCTEECRIYKKSIKRDWQEWKRTKNRKDTYRNTPRENRRRKKQKGGQALKQLTLGSLFDGIGGFCYAAGIPSGIDTGCTIKPLWAAEVEPNCIDNKIPL